MEIIAHSKSVRVSTRKVRLVADAIRHLSAQEALRSLMLVNKHGATVLQKVLKSALANAVNNKNIRAEDVMIDKLIINEGPFLKRFHASTRGRIRSYKKRSSHITVVLKEKGEKKG